MGIGSLAIALAGCGGSSTAAHTSSARTQPSTTSTSTMPASTTSLPTSTTSVPTSTTVRTFSPWTAAGTLGPDFQLLGHLSGGSCFAASIADGSSENAWRCTTDQGMYDPCLAPPGKTNVTELACAVTPYLQGGVYLLALTQPLPISSNGFTPTGTWPLVLVLSNGDQCEVIQGTATQDDFNYGCKSGNASNPSTTSEPWTVRYLPNGAHVSVTMTVTTAWE
jgi:hypothetical protein